MQTVPERQPLITEALVDAEDGTLTINGFATDGSGNSAIGYQAGNRNRTGSNNVYTGSAGEDGESGVVGGPDTHTRTIMPCVRRCRRRSPRARRCSGGPTTRLSRE